MNLQEVIDKHAEPLAEMNSSNLEALSSLADDALGCEKRFVQAQSQQRVHLTLASKYRPIDMGFLSQLDDQGWPAFAAFSISSPVAKIELKTEIDGRDRSDHIRFCNDFTHMDEILRSSYPQSVFDKLMKLNWKQIPLRRFLSSNWRIRATTFLSQEFPGLIPPEVRQQIKDANKDRQISDIAMITESTGWHVGQDIKKERIPRPRSIDPLVIGYSDHTKSCYLITAFDTTTLEDYVKREWTK